MLPLVAALTTVVLWASAFVGIRSAGHAFSPGALSLGRLVLGTLALGAVVAVRREPLPARRDLLPIAGVGLLWFGAYNVVLNQAERMVDAGTAAMVVNVGPIVIAVLAGVLLKEGFPPSLLSGLAIAFAGVIVIGFSLRSGGATSTGGAALCLLAACLYGTAVVLQKPLLRRTSALQVTFLACATGTVACLPFAPSLVHGAQHAAAGKIAWILYLGIFPTALAFTTWAYALARTTAGKLGATTYLVPPLVVVLALVLLGERPPLIALLGGAACLAGVAVARRPR